MSGVATAIAGAAVVGYVASNNASSSAASAQNNATNNARDVQTQMYNQNREDSAPWRAAGQGALSSLTKNDFMNNWQQDPGYQFRLDQGNKAMSAAASARGMNNSGRAMKELTRYGSDYASNEYGNVYNRQYNRLSQLAGIGQATNASDGANATNAGNNMANAYMNSGNAQSAAAIAQGNNTTNMVGQGANAWMQYQMMNRIFPAK